MLGRQTGRDDRQRDERPREPDGEHARDGVGLAIALLAAVLLTVGRDDEGGTERTGTDGRSLAEVAGRVRDRVLAGTGLAGTGAPGTTGAVTSGGTDSTAGEWIADLPAPVRTAAERYGVGERSESVVERYGTDDRLRKGVPVAAALLAGLLLGGQRDGATASETPERRGGRVDLVSRVRSRAASGEAADATAVSSGDAPGRSAGADGRAGGPAATGIDADVNDLSAPTTGGMPMLGVGTYRRADYDECYETVQQALEVGYRHVDTTDRRSAYYAEEAVGDAVDSSGVAREDAFVATKVTPADLDHVRTSLEESLDRLGMEYVDLLYVHWPTHDYEPRETLDEFAELRAEGLVDRIGVSNFTMDLLDEALAVADAPIFANQVEMHPLLPQTELREYCERAGVEIVAYSPIARGDVEDVDELREVAEKHGATPEQVSLAWLREKGVAAIPRATSEDHLRENWRSLALDLDVEDVLKLDAIDERRRIVDPDDAPWNW